MKAKTLPLARALERIRCDYRLWAMVPAVDRILLQLDSPSRRSPKGMVIGAVTRPRFPKGVCRGCGCTEADPCVGTFGTCAWTDATKRMCTSCEKKSRKAS